MKAIVHDFKVIRPRFEGSQQDFFEWLPRAHAQSDMTLGKPDATERYRKILRRVGCDSSRIETRGHDLNDFNHENWDEMEIFRVHENPAGVGMEVRMRTYARHAGDIFEKFYASDLQAPSDLIHVTCTGYVSPSPAQRLVASKKWGNQTLVTHAYHMGCYASFPALRIAQGFLNADLTKKRVDLVHTEICGLHLNTADHALENFVVQTLFSDGFIRYSMSTELPKTSGSGFEILGIHEEILPNTEDAMSWICGDHGMKMTLSKDVPAIVGKALPEFIRRLAKPLQLSLEDISSEAHFAVHPGGPKILDHVEEILCLRSEQIQVSREILRTHGNMSSATLPHIWEKLVNDVKVPAGALILSLAFGPGLTVCGALLKKVASR